jgi:hypothetical protein
MSEPRTPTPDPQTEPVQFYEYAKRRQARGLAIMPPPCDHRVPKVQHVEMLRLRLVEGLTLRAIGERNGVTSGRVRQILLHYFRVSGARFRAHGGLAPGERRLTLDEFEEHFGGLPTDGEG